MRIKHHPVIFDFKKGKLIEFEFEGHTMQGYEGEPISAALRANGIMAHRYTTKLKEPRGIFCAIGRCTDCIMIVNGEPNVRTCVTALQAKMQVKTQYGTGVE